MKRAIVLIIAILLIGIVIYFVALPKKLSPKPNDNDPVYSEHNFPTEGFVKKHLLSENGTIRTNFVNKPKGDIALSESIGLWLEYLAENGDSAQFALAYEALKDHFQLQNKLIAWKIEDGKKAHTNALIDDLRIIEALFNMGEQSDSETYINEAIELSNAVLTYNQHATFFVDFYDSNHQYANEQLTISYVNYNAIYYMEKYGVISPEMTKGVFRFLQKLPTENDFFPQTYNLKTETYSFNKEINLIDQLYISLHLERAGIHTDAFYNWLSSEFYTSDCLYGRYHADTKKRIVSYESAAVYALAVMYSLAREDHTFAKDIYSKMLAMQVQDDTSPYVGGFIDESTMSTHSFDNLLSLLAERKLISENIVP